MASPSSALRVASNLLVTIILLGLVALGIDAAMAWWGAAPFFTCNVLPLWLDLSDPWPLLVALAGLVLWAFTRSQGALLLFLVGLMFGVTPWVLVNYVNLTCG